MSKFNPTKMIESLYNNGHISKDIYNELITSNQHTAEQLKLILVGNSIISEKIFNIELSSSLEENDQKKIKYKIPLRQARGSNKPNLKSNNAYFIAGFAVLVSAIVITGIILNNKSSAEKDDPNDSSKTDENKPLKITNEVKSLVDTHKFHGDPTILEKNYAENIYKHINEKDICSEINLQWPIMKQYASIEDINKEILKEYSTNRECIEFNKLIKIQSETMEEFKTWKEGEIINIEENKRILRGPILISNPSNIIILIGSKRTDSTKLLKNNINSIDIIKGELVIYTNNGIKTHYVITKVTGEIVYLSEYAIIYRNDFTEEMRMKTRPESDVKWSKNEWIRERIENEKKSFIQNKLNDYKKKKGYLKYGDEYISFEEASKLIEDFKINKSKSEAKKKMISEGWKFIQGKWISNEENNDIIAKASLLKQSIDQENQRKKNKRDSLINEAMKNYSNQIKNCIDDYFKETRLGHDTSRFFIDNALIMFSPTKWEILEINEGPPASSTVLVDSSNKVGQAIRVTWKFFMKVDDNGKWKIITITEINK